MDKITFIGMEMGEGKRRENVVGFTQLTWVLSLSQRNKLNVALGGSQSAL